MEAATHVRLTILLLIRCPTTSSPGPHRAEHQGDRRHHRGWEGPQASFRPSRCGTRPSMWTPLPARKSWSPMIPAGMQPGLPACHGPDAADRPQDSRRRDRAARWGCCRRRWHEQGGTWPRVDPGIVGLGSMGPCVATRAQGLSECTSKRCGVPDGRLHQGDHGPWHPAARRLLQSWLPRSISSRCTSPGPDTDIVDADTQLGSPRNLQRPSTPRVQTSWTPMPC